jgi:hypothetical protein
MGRTYSFEPFRAQQPAQTYKGSGPRLGNDEHETALAKDMEQDTVPKSPTSYGHNHSETVTRYRKKAQARKRQATMKPPVQAKASPVKAKKSATEDKPAATRKAPVRTKEAAAAAPKSPARKTVSASAEQTSAAPKKASGGMRSIGRKVLERAATAAKRTVSRAVKTAAKTAAARKSTKKR